MNLSLLPSPVTNTEDNTIKQIKPSLYERLEHINDRRETNNITKLKYHEKF